MPTENMEVFRQKTLESLGNFPKVLKPHLELVHFLEGKFRFERKMTPSEMLDEWNKQSNYEKYYFLGWLRAGIKKIGVNKAISYINLRNKQKIDSELVIILDYATVEELRAFKKGEDAVELYRK